MITAKTIRQLSGYNAMSLTGVLRDSGYTDGCPLSAEFVGITTGGQFCYRIEYRDEGAVAQGKVFVSYDALTDQVVAEF